MLGTAGNIALNTYPVTLTINYTDWDENKTRQMYTLRHYAAPKTIKPLNVNKWGYCIVCKAPITELDSKKYKTYCTVHGKEQEDIKRLMK